MGLPIYAKLLILLILLIKSNSFTPETLSSDPSFLVTYLSSKYPDLPSVLPKPKIETLSFPDPVLQFTSSSQTLSISPVHSELSLKSISLESQNFQIADLPKLNQTFSKPFTLEILFRPVSAGPQADFLVISTSDSLLVFYLYGICKESGFSLTEVNIEHLQSSYGVSEIFITNTLNQTIEKFSVKSGNKNLSIEKTKSFVLPLERSEIAVVRSYFNTPGDYRAFIELQLDSYMFVLPVHIKVFKPQIELPRKIDFGILTAKNKIFTEGLYARSFSNANIKVISITSLNKNFVVQFSPKNVPSLSKRFQICTLKFLAKTEGKFVGKIEIVTAQQIFTVNCVALVNFGFIYVPESPYVFDPAGEVFYFLETQNKFNLDLILQDLVSESDSVIILGTSKILQIKTNRPATHWLSAHSSLGKICFCIKTAAPLLDIYHLSNGSYSPLTGPVKMGQLAQASTHIHKFFISNPNVFPITIHNITSSLDFTENLSNTQLSPWTSLDFEFSFVVAAQIEECFIVHTSIGQFFISLHSEIIKGFSKIRAVYFSEAVPGQIHSQFMYIFNSFPVPIRILSISSTYEGVSFEQLTPTVQPHKELTIAKVQLAAPLKTKQTIDWSKSLTYGDVRAWHSLHSTCEDFNKIIEVAVDIDVSGQSLVPVLISYKKPIVPIKVFSVARQCFIHETWFFYVQVENPYEYPLAMQLLMSPDNILEEFAADECLDKGKNLQDDEFENYKNSFEKAVKKKECLIRENEEVAAVKSINEVKVVEKGRNLCFIEKILQFISNVIGVPGPDEHIYETLDYNCSQGVEILERNSSKTLGPVYYTPNTLGAKNLSFILRNNYTVFESFVIPVQTLGPKLSIMKRHTYGFTGRNYTNLKSTIKKDQPRLVFDVSSEEFKSFVTTNNKILSPVFIRVFELHNLGTADAEIFGFSFENQQCRFFGFSIVNCRREFVLKPKESTLIQINYKPNIFIYTQGLTLHIKSAAGVIKYQIDVKIAEITAELCVNSFSAELLACCTAFMISALVWQLKTHKTLPKAIRSYSSKDHFLVSPPKLFIKHLSEPIFSCPEVQTVNTEPVKPELTQIADLIINSSEPKVQEPFEPASRPRGKFKYRKNAIPAQTEERPKKNQAVLPEIIATNKFLFGKGKRCLSDEPAPTPQEVAKESESDDDFFIDAYKTHNILFGGGFVGTGSLAELSEESLTLD